MGMKADGTGLSEKSVACLSKADFSEGQTKGSALLCSVTPFLFSALSSRSGTRAESKTIAPKNYTAVFCINTTKTENTGFWGGVSGIISE